MDLKVSHPIESSATITLLKWSNDFALELQPNSGRVILKLGGGSASIPGCFMLQSKEVHYI